MENDFFDMEWNRKLREQVFGQLDEDVYHELENTSNPALSVEMQMSWGAQREGIMPPVEWGDRVDGAIISGLYDEWDDFGTR